MIGPQGTEPYSVDNPYTYFLNRNLTYITDDYLRNHETFIIDCLPTNLSTLQLLILKDVN